MTRIAAPRHAALVMGAIVALMLGLTGCAKKLASVDPRYLSPEGTPSAKARMIVTPDVPIPYDIYIDEKNDGFTRDDLPDPANPYYTYASGPGAVVGTILDSTLANTYQIMRREANGGYRIAQDFTHSPAHRWLDTEWEAYSFVDPAPSGFQPPTYLGRGIVSGVVTAQSPLTNAAQAPSGALTSIQFNYQGKVNLLDQRIGILTYNPPDSSDVLLAWNPVAGAAGYWVSIYQFTGNATDFLSSTLPGPIPLSKTRDFLLVYVPAPTTSYIAYPPDPDTTHLILTSHPLLNQQYYLLRILAVDADGRIVGFTAGDNLVLLPGTPVVVGGTPKNTWELTTPSAIRLRPGPQASLAPQERAEPFRVLPARPGTSRLEGNGLRP
jgi:hypothetical protein